ncbi:hypothetical protein BS47DRAFT_1337159, partial [Hydnum rufescens UP504]
MLGHSTLARTKQICIAQESLTYHVPSCSWHRVIFFVRLQIHPSTREKLHASFTTAQSPLQNRRLWIACSPWHGDMAHSTFGKPGSSILYNRVSRKSQGFWLISRRNLCNFPQPGVLPAFWGGVGLNLMLGRD